MKRLVLLDAIDNLKLSNDVESAIDELKDLAGNFCDHYETDFNNISDLLNDLAPHIDKVNEAKEISETCGVDLY
jgi:hypothetical protein